MRFVRQAIFSLGLAASFGRLALADAFHFDTGLPNGQIATASRPSSTGIQEIESADDFFLNSTTTFINHATFYGLIHRNEFQQYQSGSGGGNLARGEAAAVARVRNGEL